MLSEKDAAVAGLIVAGGKSRRFGRDKARHPVGGTPMIARVYRALSEVAQSVVVSIGIHEATYADVLPDDVRYLRDQYPEAGPIAGLETGFRRTSATWVLAVACDMPRVTSDGFLHLLEARSEEVDVVVARTAEQRHPLFAAYRRIPALTAVETGLASESYALHALLDRLRVREVDSPPDLVHNVNRRQDLEDESLG